MKTTKEVNLTFKVSRMVYDISLPAGLKVKLIPDSEGMYWLDEFPSNLPNKFTSFCRDSFLYHDAVHYGIRLREDQVEDNSL